MIGLRTKLAVGALLFALWVGLPSLSRAEDTDSHWDAVMGLEPPASKRVHAKRTKRAKARRKRGAGVQRANPRSWHEVDPADIALHAGHEFPPLVLHAVGEPDPFVLSPQSAQGDFDDEAHAVAREAFHAWEGGPSVHPRLLALIYQATRHFDAPSCHLISGLRQDRGASRHSYGMAADVALPGVSDARLAAFFRAQGFTGVGTYPRSGFVHVDVRDASYFWIDRSPPGRQWKVVQVRAAEAKVADQEAVARGESVIEEPEKLQQALERRTVRRRAPRHNRKRKQDAEARR